jgi:CBS-domain-containing membrane protein
MNSHQSAIPNLSAEQLLMDGVPTLSVFDPVMEATPLFNDEDAFEVLPVLNPEGKLVGLFSNADLVRSRQLLDTKEFLELLALGLEDEYPNISHSFQLETYQTAYEQLTLGDMMSPLSVTVKPKTPLAEIISVFRESQRNVVPVVTENGDYVGLINGSNLLSKIF